MGKKLSIIFKGVVVATLGAGALSVGYFARRSRRHAKEIADHAAALKVRDLGVGYLVERYKRHVQEVADHKALLDSLERLPAFLPYRDLVAALGSSDWFENESLEHAVKFSQKFCSIMQAGGHHNGPVRTGIYTTTIRQVLENMFIPLKVQALAASVAKDDKLAGYKNMCKEISYLILSDVLTFIESETPLSEAEKDERAGRFLFPVKFKTSQPPKAPAKTADSTAESALEIEAHPAY